MNWHYAEEGQQAGPVTYEQLEQLFQSGKLTADTLVWRDGLSDWMPYRQAMEISPRPAAPEPTTTAPENSPKPGEVVCVECGRLFPAGDTIRIGQASVCAECKPVFLQKLSEGARINSGEMNYAGFWIRVAAAIIDGLILGVPFAIVFLILFSAVLFPAIASNKGAPPQLGLFPSLIQLVFLGVSMMYKIFFLGKYGATPGKMACKIKVVTSDGEKISYGRATGRFFAELLSGMICYIGYIIVAFDDQKRALHDHICNTRVVYK